MPYIVAQLIAGVVAGCSYVIAGHQSAASLAGVGKVLIAEFLFTFALVYVVLNVATAKANEGNSFYGLAIGMTVIAGAFAVGPISGARLQPRRRARADRAWGGRRGSHLGVLARTVPRRCGRGARLPLHPGP